MNCEIISVGTEILLGDILNTNAQYLSQRLAEVGVNVMFQCTVGDNAERLTACLDEAFARADIAILTGGLGPTPDDLTKEVCSEYFGLKMRTDEEILSGIEAFFESKGVVMPENNKKQALVPDGATILHNHNGTAPGFIMENEGRTIIILPGPPKEMEPMFDEYVYPYLKKRSGKTIKSHNVRTFGIGESDMSKRVAHLLENENPTVAPYAKSGEALLRVTAKAESDTQAEEIMKPVMEEIEEILGEYIYGVDKSSIEQVTVEILKSKGLTISFAESCTAGLCAKRITDIPGASGVFHCGVVSYSNEIKNKVLGVSAEHLEKYGAVSEVVACEMARGVKRLSGATFGASITGMAGPESDDENIPVGTMFIAVTDGKFVKVKKIDTAHRKGQSCRDYNRFVGASNVINALREAALAYPWSEGQDIDELINSY